MTEIYKVYYGFDGLGNIVYIGSTVQSMDDRARWHKANGKDLRFKVVKTFDTAEEMIAYESAKIKQHQPKLNRRKVVGFNRKLTPEQLQSRVGNNEWCQSCLKRRVNAGYNKCFYCSGGKELTKKASQRYNW